MEDQLGFGSPDCGYTLWVHHCFGKVRTRLAGAFPPGRKMIPSACPRTSSEVVDGDEHKPQAPACAPSSPLFGGPDWLAY